MDTKLVISNPTKLNSAKKAIAADGPKKLHVLSDFDGTLTSVYINGVKRPSLISVLRDGNYLTPEYAKKAWALYDKYHSLENDSTLPLQERKRTMEEWWRTHFELLIHSGLNKKDIENVIDLQNIPLKLGTQEFFDY